MSVSRDMNAARGEMILRALDLNLLESGRLELALWPDCMGDRITINLTQQDLAVVLRALYQVK